MATVTYFPPSTASGGPGAFATMRTRATTLSGGVLGTGTNASEWSSDFADSSAYATTTVGGGGAATLSTTLDGGVVQVATVATSGSVIAMHPAGKPSLISDFTAKTIYCAWKVRFDGPVDANCYLRCGLQKTTGIGGASNKNTFFGVMGSASTTNFCVETYDGVATDTFQATSTAIETTLFHLIEFYSDGTTGTWYFDGATVNKTTATSAVTATDMTITVEIVTTANTARTLSVDKMYASFLAQ